MIMQKPSTTRAGLFFCVLILLGACRLFAQQNKFSYGFSERLRNTTLNNLFDYNSDNDDKSNFFRIRTSVWGGYAFNPNLSAYLKITNENRPYVIDYAGRDKDFNLHEIFVDNLYLKASFGGKMPVTAVVGRQNIIMGEGFILLEGGPWDGSRSIYHDAVRLTARKGKTAVDVFGIYNTRDESLFPVVSFLDGDQKQLMNTTDEKAAGLYVTHTGWSDLQVEGYYFHKQEDFKPDVLTVNTLGARVSRKMKNRLAYASELALQFGSQGDASVSGLGGYAHASYRLTPKYNTILKAGVNYLSGDDPATADREGWNPIFSRWPKWSELYIYSLAVETGQVAYWTNTLSPYVELNLDFCKWAGLSAAYYRMGALHRRSFRDGSESGLLKGDEIQLMLKFKFNKYLTGHFLYNNFYPGDFYPPTSQDTGQFIRAELFYQFSR